MRNKITVAAGLCTGVTRHMVFIQAGSMTRRRLSERFSPEQTAFRDGEAVWDSTSAPGYFSHNGSASDPNINVHDAYYADVEWAGLMSGSCPNDTGLWNSDEVTIEFNLTKMDDHTAHERKIIAMHEIGHAYGLSHVSTYCRLMKQGDEKFTCASMPRPADVDLVVNLYPE